MLQLLLQMMPVQSERHPAWMQMKLLRWRCCWPNGHLLHAVHQTFGALVHEGQACRPDLVTDEEKPAAAAFACSEASPLT